MGDAISAASVFVPQTPSGDETRRRLSGKSPQAIAKEFEAIMLAQVIGAMRKTVPESGLLEASASRKMLDGAFDQEVARSLATKGGLVRPNGAWNSNARPSHLRAACENSRDRLSWLSRITCTMYLK